LFHFLDVSVLALFFKRILKGIVSRDWGRLQMVLLDRYRELDITAWGLIFFKVVNIFKNLEM
jgi:hypothetical protein